MGTDHKYDSWQVIMTENFNIILITDPLYIIANIILYSLSISVLPLMESWDRGHIQYLVTWFTAHLLNVLHAVKTICSLYLKWLQTVSDPSNWKANWITNVKCWVKWVNFFSHCVEKSLKVIYDLQYMKTYLSIYTCLCIYLQS